MIDSKKNVSEKKSEELTAISNKILFKECSSGDDFKDTFVNIKTDYSVESEQERNNISLLHALRKKLKESLNINRFLITFKIDNDTKQKKYLRVILNKMMKDTYTNIKGVCLLIHIYNVMLIESSEVPTIVSFLKDLHEIKYVKDIQILFFSELHNQLINESFYFYEYTKVETKNPISNDCSCVDEVWELYLSLLNLSMSLKNSKNKEHVFEQNENVKVNLSCLQNMYQENAKQFIWTFQDFFSFFVENYQLPLEEFSDDFIDF